MAFVILCFVVSGENYNAYLTMIQNQQLRRFLIQSGNLADMVLFDTSGLRTTHVFNKLQEEYTTCLLQHSSLYMYVVTLTEAPNISTRRSCELTSPQYLVNSLLTSLYLSSLLRSKPYFVGILPSRWTTVKNKHSNSYSFLSVLTSIHILLYGNHFS